MRYAALKRAHPVAWHVIALIARGDTFVIAIPGHAVGHQSVVIELGDPQLMRADDAAFDHDQVAHRVIPYMVENRAQRFSALDAMPRMRWLKPRLPLFTHHTLDRQKLSAFLAP